MLSKELAQGLYITASKNDQVGYYFFILAGTNFSGFKDDRYINFSDLSMAEHGLLLDAFLANDHYGF